MWTYEQSTGQLRNDEGDPVAIGYSGTESGKNNPAMQGVHNVGPIPRGFWEIGEPMYREIVGPNGPFVLPLTPKDGTETFGRDGFLIHGDAINRPGSASHGCIVLNRHIREAIAGSHDQLLKVVA